MHTHLLRAALAAVIFVLPVRSEAQTTVSAERTGGDGARVLVGELLSHRQELSLTSGQVEKLTTLAVRIREDRGRRQVVGLDRVPGKAVPRFALVYPFQREARATALRLLTPDQRLEADRILHDGKPVKTASR